LASERPDVLMLFTDPRFFIWVMEMEDEIHQVCPIVWNHLWDQCEFGPVFNKVLFDSTDMLNCINRPTYEFLKGLYPEDSHPGKVNWAPHALPTDLFKPMSEQDALNHKRRILKGKPDDEFVVLWVNRNARRKMPGDVLWSWKMFVDELQKKHGHAKATLMMHTDPLDQEGPNLFQIVDMLGLKNNVVFSRDRTSFEEMNVFYNVCDTVLNRSCAEGFGLSTLEGMYCGKPIIALKTGGLERQVVDYTDGSENGVALPVEYKTMVGSQMVPYIIEDHVKNETVAAAIMKMYDMGPEKRKALGQKAMKYAHDEFGLGKLINTWDKTLEHTCNTWKQTYKPWEMKKL